MYVDHDNKDSFQKIENIYLFYSRKLVVSNNKDLYTYLLDKIIASYLVLILKQIKLFNYFRPITSSLATPIISIYIYIYINYYYIYKRIKV